MTEERRYQEDEIQQIFEIASSERDAPERSGSSSNALTLSELQDIGRQVGIPVERITQAARSLDSHAALEYRRWPLGIPIAVRHTVSLPRAPTPKEWDVFVSTLREIFDASGQVVSSTGIYEWRNGNLHVCIEPVMQGYRLRMATRKGSAVALSVAGLVGIGYSLAFAIGLSLTGDLAQGILAPIITGLAGTGSLGAAVVRLPDWARRRGRQMEQVAAQAQALIGSAPNE